MQRLRGVAICCLLFVCVGTTPAFSDGVSRRTFLSACVAAFGLTSKVSESKPYIGQVDWKEPEDKALQGLDLEVAGLSLRDHLIAQFGMELEHAEAHRQAFQREAWNKIERRAEETTDDAFIVRVNLHHGSHGYSVHTQLAFSVELDRRSGRTKSVTAFRDTFQATAE